MSWFRIVYTPSSKPSTEKRTHLFSNSEITVHTDFQEKFPDAIVCSVQAIDLLQEMERIEEQISGFHEKISRKTEEWIRQEMVLQEYGRYRKELRMYSNIQLFRVRFLELKKIVRTGLWQRIQIK